MTSTRGRHSLLTEEATARKVNFKNKSISLRFIKRRHMLRFVISQVSEQVAMKSIIIQYWDMNLAGQLSPDDYPGI